MEKMAQMTSSLGSGHLLLTLRSPSSGSVAMSPGASHLPPPSPNPTAHSRPSVITQQSSSLPPSYQSTGISSPHGGLPLNNQQPSRIMQSSPQTHPHQGMLLSMLRLLRL